MTSAVVARAHLSHMRTAFGHAALMGNGICGGDMGGVYIACILLNSLFKYMKYYMLLRNN